MFVAPFHVPEQRNDKTRTSVGEHNAAYCPFCGKRNLAWKSEKTTDATNKCRHFYRLAKNGSFGFKASPTVSVKNNVLSVDGIKFLAFPFTVFDELERGDIENMDYNLIRDLKKVGAISSSYAFGDALTGRATDILEKLKTLV